MDIENELIGLVLVSPFLAYVLLYTFFRLVGGLRVNRVGWYACTLNFHNRIVLQALQLFVVFQPLMRLESLVRLRLSRRPRGEPAVSEVVVELVPLA